MDWSLAMGELVDGPDWMDSMAVGCCLRVLAVARSSREGPGAVQVRTGGERRHPASPKL